MEVKIIFKGKLLISISSHSLHPDHSMGILNKKAQKYTRDAEESTSVWLLKKNEAFESSNAFYVILLHSH